MRLFWLTPLRWTKQSWAFKLDKHGKDKREKCGYRSTHLSWCSNNLKTGQKKGFRPLLLSAEPAWPSLLNILVHVHNLHILKQHINPSLAVNSGQVAWPPFHIGHTGNWTQWSFRSLLLIFLTPLNIWIGDGMKYILLLDKSFSKQIKKQTFQYLNKNPLPSTNLYTIIP